MDNEPTSVDAEKVIMQQYLDQHREAVLWKLDGLSERELRMPMTATGTNLLGIVKHLAGVELGYFGEVFGRPCGIDLPWAADDAPDNADMWATAQESKEFIVDLYRRSAAHAAATIDALDLDSPGHVPWWTNGEVTLHRILVHMVAETARHAGHADIVRELIDGQRGHRADNSNLPEHDDQWWAEYVARLRRTAQTFPA